ncbi:hypothetical protein F4859DRAFT_510065 [Xylaria cf. heliscus]|nr:hypothetical protein F4859DRAFT_510065 [Xylaria cf. heliscus]
MSDTRPVGQPTEGPEPDKGASRPQQQHSSYSRPTVPRVEDFGDVAQSGDGDVGLKDLIEFFQKTPPPLSNFMSIPDHFSSSSSEEDKWDKFKTKVFRRPSKKARKKRPPVIMLPDSAVAARTTDGHRYIAISIPTEHSPLEPRPSSRYPVYDSMEAMFHRDVNSKFGMWKTAPATRLVTVLNPVPEDRRESMSSGSPLSTTVEQPDQMTALSQPSMRKRAHTVSISPSHEQRYTPGKGKDPARNRSVSDPHAANAVLPQSNERQHISRPTTAGKSEPGPSRQYEHTPTSPKDIDAAEPSTSRLPENPVITLTLPSRKSSRRGKQLEPTSPEAARTRQGSSSSTSGTNNSTGNGDGIGSGHQRNSFAASIETTSSSPQVLKATTAIVGQSIPIVVRPASADPDSPLDLNFPEPPTGTGKGKTDRLARTSAVGPPPPLQPPPLPPPIARLERSQSSRKERVRERNLRDAEKLRVQTEREGKDKDKGKGKGKGKEPASYPFGFLPGMPATLPRIVPSAILGHRHNQGREEEEQDDSSSTLSPSSSPTKSSTSAHGSGPAAAAAAAEDRAPSPTSHEQREDSEARYVAKTLAPERETLERLPRAELIARYEALREHRIYERERRLRQLERSRDAWVRAVPVLLQDLNALLRQQHRILEGAGLTSSGVGSGVSGGGFPVPPAASSQQQQQQQHLREQYGHGHHHHLRHPRPRSRSGLDGPAVSIAAANLAARAIGRRGLCTE